MRQIDTIVIGGGQAGLAASHCLTGHGHDHVVFERGHVAERWVGDTWDSLHLLTPNWLNGLPGQPYDGPDPDGFMSALGLADHLARYARSFAAPVLECTAVDALRRHGGGFEVATSAGTWRSDNVVIATGWCDRPAVPTLAAGLAPSIHQLAPCDYRNPGSLPDGGVLIVGASATGVQLAEELRSAGREVTIAVGSHTRLPRHHRGMDIFWWLDRIGALDRTIDEMGDAQRARHEPSLQLVGRPDRRSLDLASLQAAGIRLTGRLAGVDGRRASFAPDLPATVAAADARLNRLLARIDRHIADLGLAAEVLDAEPVATVRPGRPVDELDVRAAGIRSVVWATGYRRSYPWLQIPVLDEHGELRHRAGVTPVPGLYVLGQRFQQRRRSNFIGGVGRDAASVADHLVRRAAGGRPRRPTSLATR